MQELDVGDQAARDLPEAPQRVVEQVDAARRRGGVGQPVLDVVGIGEGPVGGEVAVGVVGEGGAALRRDLVEAVGGGDGLAGGVRRPGVGVVAAGAGGDLARRVVGEGQRLVVGRAGEVVGQGGQPRQPVIVVAGAVGAGSRQRRAPPEIVVGDRDAADAGRRRKD